MSVNQHFAYAEAKRISKDRDLTLPQMFFEGAKWQLEQIKTLMTGYKVSHMTICGMNCDQVHELKHFWMQHHEELPK
jgi:hypothetical protein